jgi:hypothetical protein
MAKMGGILGGGLEGGSGAGPVGFTDGEDPEETPNVTPEEQAEYDKFVKNGMEILYGQDGEVEPEVLKRLSTGNKPIDTLAQTTVWLVMLLDEDAKRNGIEVSDDILFHGARELMEQLIEIAEAAGLHEFKEAEIQGAWYSALDMWREANSDEGGRFNPEEAAAEFEALNEADKEGRADEVLPGFEQQSERAVALASADQNMPEEEEDMETKTLSKRSIGQ